LALSAHKGKIMAIKANLETNFGETRELYVRVNSVELNNHGVPSLALVRGFLSEDGYRAGKPMVYERQVEFAVDLSQPVWCQAYAAVKSLDGFVDAEDC
jgi:hypothetical protein